MSCWHWFAACPSDNLGPISFSTAAKTIFSRCSSASATFLYFRNDFSRKRQKFNWRMKDVFSRPVKTTLVRKQNGWTKREKKSSNRLNCFFRSAPHSSTCYPIDCHLDRQKISCIFDTKNWSTARGLSTSYLVTAQRRVDIFFFSKPNLTSQAVNGPTRGLAPSPHPMLEGLELCAVLSY